MKKRNIILSILAVIFCVAVTVTCGTLILGECGLPPWPPGFVPFI